MVREWLISIRESLDKSQEEIAEKSGITRQYYGMIESGQRNPSVKAAQQISKVLNINWTLFFDQTGNKKLHNNKPKEVS